MLACTDSFSRGKSARKRRRLSSADYHVTLYVHYFISQLPSRFLKTTPPPILGFDHNTFMICPPRSWTELWVPVPCPDNRLNKCSLLRQHFCSRPYFSCRVFLEQYSVISERVNNEMLACTWQMEKFSCSHHMACDRSFPTIKSAHQAHIPLRALWIYHTNVLAMFNKVSTTWYNSKGLSEKDWEIVSRWALDDITQKDLVWEGLGNSFMIHVMCYKMQGNHWAVARG